ncbi:MAG: hypothetical protein JWN38_95 [Candidatus Saccharibacteria bacterium]|nr:hypothetical protein [Candidatus Saccharibacteria bacterium]
MSELTLVYALEAPPLSYSKSIFLAGPTPREAHVESWRPEAIKILDMLGYDGVVFIPEHRSGRWHGDWFAQVYWEEHCLHLADCIAFWVPRHMVTMPGLTTNVEWGVWQDSGKTVFGAPDSAQGVRYPEYYAGQYAVPTARELEVLLAQAMVKVGNGALRTGGEREVPLYIWNTASFQQWYAALKAAGNRLDHARLIWSFRVGPERNIVFCWALHVDVYITAEDRHKTNEFVLSRPDISTVVMYQRAPVLEDSAIVLVREFRSPASNTDGYVYETPGGSSFKPGGNPLQLASEEVFEETGFHLDSSRFQLHEARQLAATFSAHQAHLFSVEITDDELAQLRAQEGTPYGVEADTERTFVEVVTLKDILQQANVDWSMLGMIMRVLTAT